MTIPGFKAAASLEKTSVGYRTRGVRMSALPRQAIIPQAMNCGTMNMPRCPGGYAYCMCIESWPGGRNCFWVCVPSPAHDW
jgi:hypothetical protein